MKTDSIKQPTDAAEGAFFLGDDWFDPLETGLRTRVCGFIEDLLEAQLAASFGLDRYQRSRLAVTRVGGQAVYWLRISTSRGDVSIRLCSCGVFLLRPDPV